MKLPSALPILLLVAAVPLLAKADPTLEERALLPYSPPAASERWPRARLLGFMREITDFVIKNHTVTDPNRKTYGMVYEFWKDGKWMQEFGLDSMHDGAWFVSALATAQRADPTGDWLDLAQQYPVPFYTNLLNHSDRLFPKMQPTDEDKHPWTAPIRGWAPRGWDDGAGIDRKTGKPFADSYFTGSNHLAQDLADALMNVWLSTRDPEIAEALTALRDYKRQCFGPIQGLEIAASVAAGQADAFIKFRLPSFSPGVMGAYYGGLFERKAQRLQPYDDGLAWWYHQAVAAAQVSGELSPGFALHALARTYAQLAVMELWSDARPYRYGEWLFDLQRPPGFGEGTGKFEEYASSSKNFFGSRGVEFAWIAAGMLPELKARPALWESDYREKHAGEPLVRIVDEPPVTDAEKDATYAKSRPIGDDSARVTLVGDPRNLHVFIETTRPQLTITFQEATVSPELRPPKVTTVAAPANVIFAAPKKSSGSGGSRKKKSADKPAAKKTQEKVAQNEKEPVTPAPTAEPVLIRGGKLRVNAEGTYSAVNEKGEALLVAAAFGRGEFVQGAGVAWQVEVRIPYTVVPGQNAWINGVEFGRYRIGIDLAEPVTAYFLSEPARIQKRLEAMVLGSIAFWNGVWKEAGFIPSGWRSPTTSAGSWEISDAGGYAHLIHAIALWLIYEDGKREWEIVRKDFPDEPIPAEPLPATVLKAQGLAD